MAFSLNTLQKNYNIDLHWRSFELRPKGSPPIPDYYLKHIEEVSRPRFIETAQKLHGITVNSGPFGIISHAALVGAKYSEVQGQGQAYHQAMFSAYWQQAQNIEDVNVLADIAESVGLNRDELLAALDSPVYEAAVMNDIGLAQQYGLTGVPAIVFENKYLVSGAQPYEVFEQVVQKLLSE